MVSKWWHEYQVVVEVVVVDDAFVAKMSGGDVNVNPYLNSQNTKGYGTATQILKPRSSKCVEERNGPKMVGLCRTGGGMRKYIWYMVGTGTKFGKKWTENGAVDGNVAARGRTSGWEAGCPRVGCPGWTGRMSGFWIRGRTG